MDSHSKMIYFFFQLFLSCVTCVVVVSSSPSSTASSLSSLSPHIISLNHTSRSEGCRSESNPGMFRRRGEVFFVGCDSKCVCTHSGVIQCEPRCSLFQGKKVSLLSLQTQDKTQDNDHRNSVCDTNNKQRLEQTSNLFIE